MIRRTRALLLSLLVSLCSLPVLAQDLPVDVELVLTVDVSLSMDSAEQRLQRDGYVAAFRHPEVIEAIQSGIHGRIAVTYVEWAGSALQQIVVPWTVIDGPEPAATFAKRLGAAPLGRMRRTSISAAIRFAASLFADNGYEGFRRVIDVSGDGPNNAGSPVPAARDQAVAQGIIVNGLPILLQPIQRFGFFDIQELALYYEACVVGGPGAFVIPVSERGELATAIRRKLVLEIAERPPQLIPASGPAITVQSTPPFDCLIGERLWEQWLRIRTEY